MLNNDSELKIIKVKNNKNNKYVIAFSNNSNLSLNQDTCIQYSLRLNKVISYKLLKEIKEYDLFIDAKNVALNLIKKKDYSINQIKERLMNKKKYSFNIIDKVINNLVEINLLNDYEFAKNYVENKIEKYKGPYYIKNGLENLKISDEIIFKILSKKQNENIFYNNCKECIKKLTEKTVIKNTIKLKNKMLYLGYDSEMIDNVIKEVMRK